VAATVVGCTSSSDPGVQIVTAEATDPAADPENPTNPSTTTVVSDVFGSGTYIVGTDIRPGMYRVFGYWARLDHGRAVIDADAVYDNGVGLMNVRSTDSYVEINGGAHPLSSSGNLNPVADGFTAGTYLVNWDIQPGRYRISAIDGGTYYARLDATGGIIGHDATDGDTIVIVDARDWALTFRGVISPA
jgi:hypothetical protein